MDEVKANIKEFVKNNPGQLMKADADWMAKESIRIADLVYVVVSEIHKDYGFEAFNIECELPKMEGMSAEYKVKEDGDYELVMTIKPRKVN